MTSQDPVTSKSHTFRDHHGDVRSRLLRARRDRVPRARTVSCFLAFSGLFPGLSLSHCFFLSFFWDGEVSVSFFFVSLLFLFVLVHGHFCSVVVGFSISQPPFPSCQYVTPSEKYTSMTSVDCRVISSLHVQFDEMKVRLGHSYVRIQASDGCKSAFELAASQQLIDPATLADAKLESTLTNENNKKLRSLIADLKSHVKLALPCELTRQNRPVNAGLPRRRTTTRSRTVRLNSKLSKATLTSRTEEIRRQNIRLNSCSFTLKERPDSDDVVRQKSSKKQRKSLQGWYTGDAGMLTFRKDRDRGSIRSVRPAATCVGMLRYSMTTTRKVKDHVLTTWSEEESLPWNVVDRHSFEKKITPGMSDSFETLQEYFWTIDASFKRKKED